MKLNLTLIKSFLGLGSQRNVQSAKIEGDHNSIYQVTNIYTGGEGSFKREWLAKRLPSSLSSGQPYIKIENSGDEDREEIKRIFEYRKIAIDGDSATALSLLENLRDDEKYSSGYVAFRLNFNIGVVQQNIGELDSASASLRAAYDFCPEDKKAQTGLAFAELIDGEDEKAFERAKYLLEADGDHKSLAACISLHAAKRLQREFYIEDYDLPDLSHPDVVAARLEFLSAVRPQEYSDALCEAFEADESNDAVASMWALSVLNDIKQNQAFLLGKKMSGSFDEKVEKSATILRRELEKALSQRPPNELLLPLQANNAAVALRLAGKLEDAAKLIDKTLEDYPEFQGDLAQIRAVLFLHEDKDSEAFEIIEPLKDHADLQVLASEIEAKMGRCQDALDRINAVLNKTISDDLRSHALSTKARIGINSSNRDAADEAIEELAADFPTLPELVVLKSAYNRAFEMQAEKEGVDLLPAVEEDKPESDKQLLASLKNSDDWDFVTLLQAANELFARGYYRECTGLLQSRVSYSKESPALQTLCDACLHGRLGSLAKEISRSLAPEVKNSVFGWKFDASVGQLNGEIAKTVPLTRKLFEQNPKSISALDWYVQSLLRMNDRNRVLRLVGGLDDDKMVGTVPERSGYVNLLVFCGKIERARDYAYRLFCENRNDHRAWMALSSSVLAFGKPPGTNDNLDVLAVGKNAAFEVVKPDGDKQTFVIECDDYLFPLREGNIRPDHPVAKGAMAKVQGESFVWPFGNSSKEASIVSVKHKALEAFHFILKRFEEQFPDASGFKSVPINVKREDGLDEMKAMLQQRAEYAQQKAREYHEGTYPLPILGFHLGIDPIDAFLGLKHECGFSPKVSSNTHVDQDKASAALKLATKQGILADAVSCHLLRRLDLESAVEQEFGKIGVTQNTIDIFSKRLQESESACFFDSVSGSRRAGRISVREGRIVLSELGEDEVNEKVEVLRGDLEWVKSSCELVPAVAKTDPDDAVIRFRNEEGGRFFDDIFASDGSDRVLLSEDYHLRNWSEGLFGIKSAWMQALLFHLHESGRIPTQSVVKGTIQLCYLGEEVLSTNSERLLCAAEMFNSGELSVEELEVMCSLLGQPGADMRSHLEVAVFTINKLWKLRNLSSVKERVTSVILRKLIRHQGSNSRVVLDAVQTLFCDGRIRQYISRWRVGHFL
ncbi:PIN domain-containing protein [Halomonas alimentaria]|uniref:PIN domain-containing protein n=1 Tax=Halomonas alimentaria TaxID=147248 RepID=UPI00248F6F20|nr:hypothetical protein [Halomonas alimentaria]